MSIKDVLETVRAKEHEIKDNLIANSGQSWSCTSSCMQPKIYE